MKKKCSKCLKNKAQRQCRRVTPVGQVCSLCCVEMRSEECGDCEHRAVDQAYRNERASSGGLKNPYGLPPNEYFIEVNPEVEDAVERALQLAQQGALDEAWERIDALHCDHPINHIVLYGMGVLHALEGEHEECLEYFDKALAVYPYFVEAQFNKAVAHQKMLDVGGAIRAYRRVVEIGKSGDPEVQHAQSFLQNMAKIIRRNEGLDLDAYLEAQVLFDQAFDRMRQGDYPGALEGFRAAAAINDRNPTVHGNLGLCLAQLGHKAKALEALDRALELNSRYEPARMNRLLIDKMEEGKPLEGAKFVEVDFSKEQVLQNRKK